MIARVAPVLAIVGSPLRNPSGPVRPVSADATDDPLGDVLVLLRAIDRLQHGRYAYHA